MIKIFYIYKFLIQAKEFLLKSKNYKKTSKFQIKLLLKFRQFARAILNFTHK